MHVEDELLVVDASEVAVSGSETRDRLKLYLTILLACCKEHRHMMTMFVSKILSLLLDEILEAKTSSLGKLYLKLQM